MALFSGITVICFAASYSVALVLEVTRMLFRSGVRGAVMLGFAGAGLVAQTLFLANRAMTASGAPLSSAFDWYLLAAWVLVIAYLYLTWYHPRTAMGLFLLPLVLGLIGLAHFAEREPFPQSHAGQVWGAIHGLFLMAGLVAVVVGFVAGVMYLIQSYRLKHKVPPASGVRLPSLEWLERVNSRSILLSALMFGIGFASGIVLNMVSQQRKIDEVPWSDPIIWRTGLMFGWLLIAAIFSAAYRPARGGRKVAYLTVANFVFLAAFLAMQLLVPSEHGGAIEKQKAENRRPASEFAISTFAFHVLASDFQLPTFLEIRK